MLRLRRSSPSVGRRCRSEGGRRLDASASVASPAAVHTFAVHAAISGIPLVVRFSADWMHPNQ
jgi:hypothetical protein